MIVAGEKVKLPKAFKTKWVKALRSGKYKQQSQILGDAKNGYCCLGVACSISGVSDKKMKNHGMPSNLSSVTKNELRKKGFPEQLLDRGNPGNAYVQDKLVEFNDSYRGEGHKTFKGIATWIEKNL